MCDKRRGWKTHVPVHTCLPSAAKRHIKGTGGGGDGKGGAVAFTSLKRYQSVFVRDFSRAFAKTAAASAAPGGFGDPWWRREEPRTNLPEAVCLRPRKAESLRL